MVEENKNLDDSTSCISEYSNFSDRLGGENEESNFYVGSLPHSEDAILEELRNDYSASLEGFREKSRKAAQMN